MATIHIPQIAISTNSISVNNGTISIPAFTIELDPGQLEIVFSDFIRMFNYSPSLRADFIKCIKEWPQEDKNKLFEVITTIPTNTKME